MSESWTPPEKEWYALRGRKHVRYYRKNGRYLDHGRAVALKGVEPTPGSTVTPFPETTWKVVEVRWPENYSCLEVYVDYDGEWMAS